MELDLRGMILALNGTGLRRKSGFIGNAYPKLHRPFEK